MAIQPMNDAVAGGVASSAEYNKLIDNIQDLDARLGPVVAANTADARLDALEALKLTGSYFGQWTDDNAGEGQPLDTSDGEKITAFTNATGTNTGVSISGGTATVTNAGLYMVTASLQFTQNTGSVVAMWLSKSGNASGAGLPKIGATSGYRSDVLNASGVLRLGAGGVVSVYAAIWQSTPSINIYKAASNTLTVTYLGP